MADPWTEWLARYGPALVLLARQWVPSHADAEDAVQEAFVRCWRARSTVQDPAAYLFATVKRCAMDSQRQRCRQSRREATAARPESEPLFSPAEQDERRAAIEAALTHLPAEQREVLLMKIWGGLSVPQIAGALAIPVNTASSRYRYALEKLHAQLAEESIR